jgi:hypothetical protein
MPGFPSLAPTAKLPRSEPGPTQGRQTPVMADAGDNVDTETFREIERLRQLRIEHRDLDDVIHRLQLDLYVDQVQLRRLKKRKLLLKDQIARLESLLIPDLNA